MIDDAELRSLFQAENEERIHQIDKRLKELELDPQNSKLWEDMMRDIHTIKGSARMLKVQSIEILSHHFEDLLDKIRKKTLMLTPMLIAFFYEVLDSLQSLVNEEIGEPFSAIDLPKILEKIHGFSEKKEESPLPQANEPGIQVPIIKEEFKKSKSEKLENAKIHISTIRVNLDQINSLMKQVTELSVVRTHMEQLFEEVESLLSNYEENKNGSKFVGTEEEEEKRRKQFREKFENQLFTLRNNAYNHIHKLQQIASQLVGSIRTISLIPISKLFDLFPAMVREIAKSCGKEVDLEIQAEEIGVDKKIIEELKDPLIHLVRNSISHGIESSDLRAKLEKTVRGKIVLRAHQTEHSIIVEVEDDGAGLNLQKIKAKALQAHLFKEDELEKMSEKELQMLIFMPGFSTAQVVSDISGRGVGLDVVQASIEELHGNLKVVSNPGQGCKFIIELPINFVTTKVMLVEQDERVYAVPIDLIEVCLLITIDQILVIDEKDVFYWNDHPYPVFLLRELLSLPKKEVAIAESKPLACIIISNAEKKFALLVDNLLEEQELVVVTQNKIVLDVPGIVGATILKNGEGCVVINPAFLQKSSDLRFRPSKLHLSRKKKKSILVVDDSSTSRAILKHALETEGYMVSIAEDGVQALEKLSQKRYDLVVTDVDMPKMNGFELTENIRTQYHDYLIPIIIFTSLSSKEEINRGMSAGASAYIVKSEFSQQNLIKTLKEILI